MPGFDSPLHPGIQPLKAREFRLFQALIYEEAGIYLSEVKRALLVSRLSRRVRELGLTSFQAYYDLVLSDRRDGERVRLINSICTHETSFFREPRQFDFLERSIIPQWIEQAQAGLRPRRVNAWSAGCSSREEPYSIAMSLLSHLPPANGWTVRVLATDISTSVLERAETALWPAQKSRAIPDVYLRRYMLRGTGEHDGRIKAGPEIRSIVEFQQVNLNTGSLPVSGPFDLIFCRNVLIYFDAASRTRVVHQLLNRLDPSGFLFLGHAESLHSLPDRPRGLIPSVYTVAPA